MPPGSGHELQNATYHLIAQHAFVATPSSHGQDTYRFWETLYLGSVPVMLHGPLDKLYEHFPCVLLDHWHISEEELLVWRAKLVRRFGSSPTDAPRVQAMLRSDFWARHIQLSGIH